jgi:hypothetical protein
LFSTLLLILLVGQQPTPEVEVIEAAVDLGEVLEQDRPYMRYLSLYSLDPKDRPNAIKVARFWCNSLSLRKRMSFPESVTPTLLRVDTRLYEWDPEAWEGLTQEDPYFRFSARMETEPANPERTKQVQYLRQADRYLRYYTRSAGAVLRLDFFMSRTAQEPHYSRFLGLPRKLEDLKQRFYLQKEAAKSLYLLSGGAVMRSRVALNNRKITRVPSILGYWYETLDMKSNDPEQNQNVLHNLFNVNHDAGEFIWSLPNDLQGYYLADNKGNQVAVVPPDIAVDSITTYRDKQVTNARSCVVCHANGINTVDDVISRIVQENAKKKEDFRVISALTQEKRLELEEFYMGGLAGQIRLDQTRYQGAIEKVNGLDGETNAAIYQQLLHGYDETYLTRARAAKELGITEDAFRQAGQHVLNNILAAQLGGEGIPRDAWEKIYPSVSEALAILQGGAKP